MSASESASTSASTSTSASASASASASTSASASDAEPPPQLDDVLQTLKNVIEGIETDADYRRDMATQLKETHGYDDLEAESSAEGVMKVFALVLKYIFQMRVNLTEINNDEVEESLYQLLTRDKPRPGSLSDYLKSKQAYAGVRAAKSPLDLAKYLKKGTPQWFVRSLIQHQFDIKWDTDNGEPEDYTFYQFCGMKNTSSFLKYYPRQDHVKATLYKECRIISHDVQGMRKEELCPMVYIKARDGWKRCQVDGVNFAPVEDIDDHLNWIHIKIREFIKENADVQEDESEQSLTTPTLYWAVLENRDFRNYENLELNEISKTQVYVGKAINGIQGRWTRDGDNHCSEMKRCLNNVCAMTTYDPLRLEGISLVDARLALAKVREEETALFVIKTFGDEFEKAKMSLLACLEVIRKTLSKFLPEPNSELLEYEDEIFPDVVTIFSDDAETLSNEAEEILNTIEKYLYTAGKYLHNMQDTPTLKKLYKNLNEATTCVNDLRNDSKKELVDRLKKAEKQHQDGKRILNENLDIIPYPNDPNPNPNRPNPNPNPNRPNPNPNPNERWQPKDMRYGMNS